MPRTWVLVPTPAGETSDQPVFVNGPAEAGSTDAAFRVEVGFNTFALRNGGVVTWRRRDDCPPRATEAKPHLVILSPVAAPAFGMAPAPTAAAAPVGRAMARPRRKAAKKKKTTKKAAKRKATKPKSAKKAAKPKAAPKRKAAPRRKPK